MNTRCAPYRLLLFLLLFLALLLSASWACADVVLPEGIRIIEEEAFCNCTDITRSITIPQSVEVIGARAFYGCTGLWSIKLPAGIQSIGEDAFAACDPYFAIYGYSGTVAETYANENGFWFIPIIRFEDIDETTCKLTGFSGSGDVVIPSEYNGKQVVGIGDGVFEHRSDITSVYIPDGVTFIGDYVFYECTGLKSLRIPASLNTIGWHPFNGCTSLTAFDLDANNAVFSCQDGVLFTGGGTVLFACPAGKTGAYTVPAAVTEIEKSAFSGSLLSEIILHDDITQIGGYAFSSCQNLRSIVLPEKLRILDYCAFADCPKLESVTIPKNLSNIGDAFYSCPSLVSLNAEGSNYFTVIDGVLFDLSGTKLTLCPGGKSGILTIPNGTVEIASAAFGGCAKLTEISIPDSVQRICYSAFENCAGLTSIALPPQVTRIEMYTFNCCSNLTEIMIPNGVQIIEERTFSSCDALEQITFPASVTQIDGFIFAWSNRLSDVTILNSAAVIDSQALANAPSDVVIHGFAGSTAEAFAADNGFAFEAIEANSQE